MAGHGKVFVMVGLVCTNIALIMSPEFSYAYEYEYISPLAEHRVDDTDFLLLYHQSHIQDATSICGNVPNIRRHRVLKRSSPPVCSAISLSPEIVAEHLCIWDMIVTMDW
ncbi:hypothetical protein ACE6H2_000923 [Prunus campanulata]